ncbi:MAG: hypothetical protein FWD05_06145 [Oscillospiraceae bacterium]|nr:hypothetical protein [Oscillospiraceae bacterium]
MINRKTKMLSKGTAKFIAILMSLAILFSMLAFMSNIVGAATGNMWDLSNFVQSVTMTDANGNVINSGSPTYVGESYTFSINFTENTQRQLSYSGSPVSNYLVFQLPSQLRIQNPVGPSPIPGPAPANVTVGTYSIDTSGQVTVQFKNVDNAGNSTPGNFIDNYTNVNFWLNITAQLMDGGDGSLDFGNIVVDIVPPVPPPPQLNVIKQSEYNPATERIYYTITITALGSPVTNINLVDSVFINNVAINNTPTNALFGFRYAINGSTNFMPMGVNWLGSGGNLFTYNFAGVTLNPTDYITVYFYLDLQVLAANNGIDLLNYDFNVTNSASVTGDGGLHGNDNVTNHVQKTFPMSKTGVLGGGSGSDPYYIEWTITVGPSGATPLNSSALSQAAKTITDTLGADLFFIDPTQPTPNDAYDNINIELYDSTILTNPSATPTFTGNPNEINTYDTYFTLNSTTGSDYNSFTFVLPPPGITLLAASSLFEIADYESPDDIADADESSAANNDSTTDTSQAENDPTDDDEIDEEEYTDSIGDTLPTDDSLIDEETQIDDNPDITSLIISAIAASVDEDTDDVDEDDPEDEQNQSFEVASDEHLEIAAINGDIYKVIITFKTEINAPPTIAGHPAVVYQNNVTFGDYGRTGIVPFNPPAITINKQTSGICGTPAAGYWVDYSINFTIPAGNDGQEFFIYDTLGMMPGGGSVANTPDNFVLTATNASGSPIPLPNTGPVPNTANSWKVYLNGTDSNPDSGQNIWNFLFDVNINITYSILIPIDTVNWLKAGNSRMIQNTTYLVNGPVGRTPGDGVAISVGGSSINDYWPIFKSAQGTSNPALFNYTVILNGAYSGRPNALFQTGSPAQPSNPVFTDTFSSMLSYVPGTFYVRDAGTGYIYAPPPGTDVTVSGSSFNVTFRSLQRFSAPPSAGGTPIDPSPADPTWFTGRRNYEVHYQLILRDQYLEVARPNLTNVASIAVSPGACTFQSTATVNYSPEQISKTVTTNGSDMAHVEIIVNPDGGYVFSDGVHAAPNQIVARDVLTNLMVYLTQIQVYTETYVGGHWDGVWKPQPITFNDGALWSANVVSSDVVDFVLPNEQPVKIVYDALITLEPGSPGTVNNIISIFGVTGEDGENNYVVNNTTGGASADALRLRLFKQDPVNNINVPGAVFTLYVTDLENPGLPPYGITDPPRVINGVNFYPLVTNRVTDNFGIAIFDNPGINTTFEFLFMLYEDVIPMGYSPQPQNPTPLENSTFFTIKPNINQTLLANAVNTINSNLPSGQITVNQITDFITVNNIPERGAPGSLRLWKLFTGIDITDQHYLDQLSDFSITITDPRGVRHNFTLAQALDPFGIVINNAIEGTYLVQEYNANVQGYNMRTTPDPLRFYVMPNMDREYVIQMNNIYTIPWVPLPPGVPNYPESLNVLKVVNGLTDEQVQQNLKDAVIYITGPAGFNETISLIDAINGVTFEDVPQGSYFFSEANANVNGFSLITTPQVPFRRYILPTTSGAVTILITNDYTPIPDSGRSPQTGVRHNILIPALLVALGGGVVVIAEVHRRRRKNNAKDDIQ